jgi:pimeloyl-ACP methyl ester carboxylesterase
LLLGTVFYIGLSTVAVYKLTEPRKLDFPLRPEIYENVKFPASGEVTLNIASWFLVNERSDNVLILVHGKDMSKGTEFQCKFTEFGKRLHDSGFNVLLIDLRGHGGSDHSHVSFGINERYDIIGAVNWLKNRGFKAGKIGVLGVSMGGASALGAAAEEPAIGAIVSDCSYSDISPILTSKWGDNSGLPDFYLPSTLLMGRLLLGYNLREAKPIDDIKHLSSRPVLLIHSKGDTMVPVQHAHALKSAYPAANLWITGQVDHCLSYWSYQDQYTKRVVEFFQSNLN